MTANDYKEYVLDQLKLVDGITCKPMMGEYLLYRNGKLFGGIYDNRLLIKKTETNSRFELSEEIPYPSAKPMYMIGDENPETVKEIVYATCAGLK